MLARALMFNVVLIAFNSAQAETMMTLIVVTPGVYDKSVVADFHTVSDQLTEGDGDIEYRYSVVNLGYPIDVDLGPKGSTDTESRSLADLTVEIQKFCTDLGYNAARSAEHSRIAYLDDSLKLAAFETKLHRRQIGRNVVVVSRVECVSIFDKKTGRQIQGPKINYVKSAISDHGRTAVRDGNKNIIGTK